MYEQLWLPSEWIWASAEKPQPNSYAYFRRRFALPLTAHLKGARLVVTADSRYQLWVNGVGIARGRRAVTLSSKAMIV